VGGNDYYIGSLFAILASHTLTIEAGVNVYYEPGASILLKGGRLRVLGTVDEPVTFAPQHGSDGSAVKALVLMAGFNYSAMVLQNAIFDNVGQSVVDNPSAGSNVGSLSAANITLIGGTTAFAFPININQDNNVPLSQPISINGFTIRQSTVSFRASNPGIVISNLNCLDSVLTMYLTAHIGAGLATNCSFVGLGVGPDINGNGYSPEKVLKVAGVTFVSSTILLDANWPGVTSAAFPLQFSECTFIACEMLWGQSLRSPLASMWHAHPLQLSIVRSSFLNCSLNSRQEQGGSGSWLLQYGNSASFLSLTSSTVTGTSFDILGGVVIDLSYVELPEGGLVLGQHGANTITQSTFRPSLGPDSDSIALVVNGLLAMADSMLDGFTTLFVFGPGSASVSVSNCLLLSSLNASASPPPYLVENNSPYSTNLSNNYWGDGFQAATGDDSFTGLPVYVLSSFIYDVYSNVTVGEVLFAPFAAAPPPPLPPLPPPSPSPPPLPPQVPHPTWHLVRRVASLYNGWHPATDALAGTASYGTPGSSTSASTFSLPWASGSFTHFLFATGDESVWVIASSEAVLGANGPYGYEPRTVLCSSSSATPYDAVWPNRGPGYPEDPWVSVADHASSIPFSLVYGESSYANGQYSWNVVNRNGANVFIGNISTGMSSPCALPTPSTPPPPSPPVSVINVTLTGCGATDANEPSLTDCISLLGAQQNAPASAWPFNYSFSPPPSFISPSGTGWQMISMPPGSYYITAAGAAGLMGAFPDRCRGAALSMPITSASNLELYVMVGQIGGWSEAGGGGTFVFLANGTLLLVGGGAGGSFWGPTAPFFAGCDAAINATSGNPSYAGNSGGKDGAPGNGQGNAGCGLIGIQAGSCTVSSFNNNCCWGTTTLTAVGGGGSARGGGGYSGGAGCTGGFTSWQYVPQYCGGGGSFCALGFANCSATFNTGDGYVTITSLAGTATTP
jgi:hypothetical protein